MTIVDIDQDFFYKFIGKNSINGVNAPCDKDDLVANMTMKKFFKDMSLGNVGFKLCFKHDEVYYELKRMGVKEVKLLHFDRHDDLDKPEYDSGKSIHIGNWIDPCIKEDIVTENIWISFNDSKPHEETLYDKCKYSTFHYNDYIKKFADRPDFIFFTVSQEFCPDNQMLLDFLYEVDSVTQQLGDQRYV